MADNQTITVQFDADQGATNFRVETASRTITGLAVPWGAVARSGGAQWRFQRGSLSWGPRPNRVKLNLNHDHDKPIGVATILSDRADGLEAAFRIASGPEGDRMLSMAQDGILDGFSIEVDFQRDSYQPDASDREVNNVVSAHLRGVALTHEPAFDGARVESIAARAEREKRMATEENNDAQSDTALVTLGREMGTFFTEMKDLQKHQAETTLEAVGKGIAAFVADRGSDELYVPKATPNIQFISEPTIYTFGRAGVMGESLIRDAYYAHFMRDDAARDRYQRFQIQQTALKGEIMKMGQVREVNAGSGAQFAVITTSGASQIIPPGYRPDLYVPELLQGRPLTDGCSRGTIENASPFTVPVFATASGRSQPVTAEGVNPASGATTFATKTVQPKAFSGLMEISREIADSSNPMIDQILLNGMREEYARDTEAEAYAMFNSATLGLGGTITAGFVPSGAQVLTSSGTGTASGRALLNTALALATNIGGIRAALSRYQFNRYIEPTQGVLSQEATTLLATSLDTTERPLLASIGSQNAMGTGNARSGAYTIDTLPFRPAWSITGNTATDFDVAFWNQMDVWVFESPLLLFRYEEVLGPGAIRLGLWGYYGIHVLRPVGLAGVRHTHTP